LSLLALVAAAFWAIAGRPGHAILIRPAPAVSGGQIELVAVFGADDRARLPDRYKALQKTIGLLYNNRSRTVCSAFCVAEDIVATAAHCIYRTAGEVQPRTDGFVFTRPGSGEGRAARIAGAGRRSAAQHVLAGSAELSVRPPIDAARDWALVRLERPACQGEVLPVKVMPADDIIREAEAKRLFQIGFHRDFMAWRPVYSQPCEAGRNFGAADWPSVKRDFAEPGHLILHTCDTGGASSGSPLLIDTPAGPEVVAINVGTYMQARVLLEDGEVVHRSKAGPVANTGVGSEAFAEKLALFRQAVILPNGAAMRVLQSALKSRGLYSGALDGAFGSSLRRAILAYERGAGLPEMGLATEALLKRLEAESPARRGAPRV
jgi:protease YdgD